MVDDLWKVGADGAQNQRGQTEPGTNHTTNAIKLGLAGTVTWQMAD